VVVIDRVFSFSEDDTIKFVDKFYSIIKGNETIIFNGDLGTGKTFFIKNLLLKYDISEVTSPTFTIVNNYFGKINVFHIDFYRIKNEKELYDIGIDEYLSDNNAMRLVEWANLYPNVIKQIDYEIQIRIITDSKREIILIQHHD